MSIKFVKLTELDGRPREWIVPAWVMMVRDPIEGETRLNCKAAVVLSGVTVFVEEEPEEAMRLIEEAS